MSSTPAQDSRLRLCIRTLIALLATVVALPFLAGTAQADPAQSETATKDGVTVTATKKGAGVQALVSGGTAAVENGRLVFRNGTGTVIETIPLSYIAADQRTYPIDATVRNNRLALHPSTDAGRSTATDPTVLNAAKRQVAGDPPVGTIALATISGAVSGALGGLTFGGLLGAMTGVGLVLLPFTIAGGALLGGALSGGMVYLDWQQRQQLQQQRKQKQKQKQKQQKQQQKQNKQPSRTAPSTKKAAVPQSAVYKNCSEARAAGAAPIRRGQSGYSSKLDRDGDGIACE